MKALWLRLLLTISMVCLASPGQAITDDEVQIDYRDGLYIATLHLKTPAPPATALKVLTDFEHMADFMPGVLASRIVSHHGNIYEIAQRGKVSFGPFSMTFESLRRIEVINDTRILSRSISGSAKRMQSEMKLRPQDSGTLIDYHIEIEPDSWIPSSLGSNFLQHELAEQFNALGREMLRRRGTPQP
ncbi:SRPBCC family protein [Dechloromonas sp. ARDL1]|uniref:SRPBCC family protein n=1 Tax=Dechloromonas sp. ARDL1 TaxID=3322121 RepID=UPI003DA6E663